MFVHLLEVHDTLKLLYLEFFKLSLLDFLASVFDSVEHSGVLVWAVVTLQYILPEVTDEGNPSFFVCHKELYCSIAFSNIISVLCISSLQSTYASRT